MLVVLSTKRWYAVRYILMSTKLIIIITDFRPSTYSVITHTFEISYTVYSILAWVKIITVNLDQDADLSPRGTHVNCFEAFDRDSENFPVRITIDNIFDIRNSSPRRTRRLLDAGAVY